MRYRQVPGERKRDQHQGRKKIQDGLILMQEKDGETGETQEQRKG